MKIINYPCLAVKNKTVEAVIIALLTCWILTVPVCAETIRITAAANHRTVEMKVGDNLELTLAGNPTTGYVWEKVAGDNTILSLQGDYKYIPARSALVGSGGKFVFTFLGAAPGKTKLRLIYSRPFEKDTAPIKTFAVKVIVK